MPQNIIRIAVVVGVMLLVPLFGNLFIEGWDWGVGDFIVMGALLFVTGLAIDFAVRKLNRPLYRVIAVGAIVMMLILLWAELAVDAVSQSIRLLFP